MLQGREMLIREVQSGTLLNGLVMCERARLVCGTIGSAPCADSAGAALRCNGNAPTTTLTRNHKQARPAAQARPAMLTLRGRRRPTWHNVERGRTGLLRARRSPIYGLCGVWVGLGAGRWALGLVCKSAGAGKLCAASLGGWCCRLQQWQ